MKSAEQKLRDIKLALRTLQANEVTRVMGFPSTPGQIRARADHARDAMYRLAGDVQYLADEIVKTERLIQLRAVQPVRSNRRRRRSRRSR